MSHTLQYAFKRGLGEVKRPGPDPGKAFAHDPEEDMMPVQA